MLEAAAVSNQVGNGAAEKGDDRVDEDEDGDVQYDDDEDEDGEDGEDGEGVKVRGEGVVENVDEQFVQEWEEDVLATIGK